jgi:hypothetical protein
VRVVPLVRAPKLKLVVVVLDVPLRVLDSAEVNERLAAR